MLEQADGTGWMAIYCLNMLEIAIVLAAEDPAYEDVAVKFFEHFTMISQAINEHGLWDEEDGFYYDRVRRPDGTSVPVRVRSMTGLIPLCAVAIGNPAVTRRLTEFRERVGRLPARAARVRTGGARRRERAPHDARARGRQPPAAHPRAPRRPGRVPVAARDPRPVGRVPRAAVRLLRGRRPTTVVDYEPAESTTGLFGGNSNWRGPIWFPVNYLVIGALLRFSQGLDEDFTVEFPTGSGDQHTLREITIDLAERLVAIFLPREDGTRPVFGGQERFRTDPAWRDALLFHEYFHGDDGAGLGASHQTGWTGLVADLVIRLSWARERA